MTPERWQQIKQLLEVASELDLDERPGWLAEACGSDTELRREVESYLAHEDELTQLSGTLGARSLLSTLAPEPRPELGRVIGPYRLERLLGQGGMGSVYLARREAEFEQEVALKLVRRGFETPAILERFHTERQILARLEHPNIARLLDGGTTEDGTPYFVMERIDGSPIDRYCDDHRMSIPERIELLLPICEALRFAHRNLVVHRDLKPSNILVTEDGIPKLLDFGIGKLLAPEVDSPSKDNSTAGAQPLTVAYASPEQLLGQSITTASDVYSLGVVLYELLTGSSPYGVPSDSQAKWIWAICHDPPTRPSQLVSPLTTREPTDPLELEARAETAQLRRRSPRALARDLRGDLDAIVLEALEKDPAQRYASIEQMAADLRHYLEDLPVTARRGNPAYHAAKFVRRHRWPLGAGVIALMMILTFTFALMVQLERTERQKIRAERLSDFLVNLFRAAEPDRAGAEPSVRELVDIGLRRLETELEEEPEARARMLGTLGQVHYRLGNYWSAAEAHQESIAVLRRATDRDHPLIATALNNMAASAFAQGNHPRAEELSREALDMRRRLGVESELTKPRSNLAALLMLRGKLDEAAEIYREALEYRRTTSGPRSPNVASSLRNLATVLYLEGDFSAAEPLLHEALDIRIEAFGRESASVAKVLASLGRLAHAQGELERAELLYLEALSIRRERLGPEHLEVAILEKDLADLLLDRGDPELAGILLSHAFETINRHKPEGDWVRADSESVYGAFLAAMGRREEAATCLEEGARALELVRGPDVLPAHDARRRLEAFHAF